MAVGQAVKEQHFQELEKLKRSMNEREAAGENAWESRASARPSDTHLLTSSALPQVCYMLGLPCMIARQFRCYESASIWCIPPPPPPFPPPPPPTPSALVAAREQLPPCIPLRWDGDG